MRKVYFLVTLLVISMLTVSIVMAINDSTPIPNTAKCSDIDGGVYSATMGAVRISSFFGLNVVKTDLCRGKARVFYNSAGNRVAGRPIIREYYCSTDDGGNDIAAYEDFSEDELGAGYCVYEDLNIAGERTRRVAKWVPTDNCVELKNSIGTVYGVFNNEERKLYSNVCTGAGRKTFKSYTCSADKTSVITTTQNCSIRCHPIDGCSGTCTDTDPQNDKNLPGVVTLDGVLHKDTCVGTNKVKQYECTTNGMLRTLPVVNCGVNRECVTDTATGAAKCKDKYTGTDTIETLREAITTLQNLIDALTARIEALEGAGSGE